MFIMLDGIDGSGKSTIIDAWKKYLSDEGNGIFDLKNYWLTAGQYPDYSELKAYEFVLSGEPTYVGVGKVMREEMIKNGTAYGAEAIAQGYSLDRLVLYKKIIIPALADEKCVIQDRGISSSLAYQYTDGLTFEEITALPGNQLALEYRPDHLILAEVEPQTAVDRLAGRDGKKDNVIFEKLPFLIRLADTYRSPEFTRIFTEHGTRIHRLNANAEIGIMKKEAIALLKQIINS